MLRARIYNAKNSNKRVAELHLYGDVSPFQMPDMDEWGFFNLKLITEELKSLGGVDAFDEILLRINSCGGDVEEGFAIYSYFLNIGKPVTTLADGRCHSIASIIFMAGDVRKIYKTTNPVIHLASGGTWGNANEMEEYANMLRDFDEQMLDIYAERTGTDKEAIRPYMQNDNHMRAETFLELKFATEIIEPVKATAKVFISKKETVLNNDTMSKIEEFISKKFDGVKAEMNRIAKALGMKAESEASSKTFKTTDGKDLDIETDDNGDIKIGGFCNLDGAAAPDGDYPLEDGRTVVVAEGKVSEVKAKEEESAEEKEAAASAKAKPVDIKALQLEMINLKTQVGTIKTKDDEIASLKTENEILNKDIEKVYAFLKTVKVEANIPARTGLEGKEKPEVETTVAEAKAKIQEKLNEKNKKAELAK